MRKVYLTTNYTTDRIEQIIDALPENVKTFIKLMELEVVFETQSGVFHSCMYNSEGRCRTKGKFNHYWGVPSGKIQGRKVLYLDGTPIEEENV